MLTVETPREKSRCLPVELNMGQYDKSLRLLVVDPDTRFAEALRSLKQIAIEVVFVEPSALADAAALTPDHDVIVICVENAASLALVADTCRRPDAPPVIAIGAKGFDHRSLEHILLLAEVRGAVAALRKPIEAAELVLAATRARRGASPDTNQFVVLPHVERMPAEG